MSSNQLKVEALYYYPVKSCAGVKLDKAQITRSGIKNDRSFFLVNQKHKLVTAREIPACVRVLPELNSESLTLQDLDQKLEPITLPLPIPQATPIQTTIWRREAHGWDCGEEVAKWLYQKLGKKVRLVKASKCMHVNEDVKYRALAKKDDVSNAQDLTPFHILSKETIDALSSTYGSVIDFRRFRPNILISGCLANDEDIFDKFSIGNHIFHQTKLCNRCTFPGIDPETARRDALLLKAIRKARTGMYDFVSPSPLNNECFVGTQCGHSNSDEGFIEVGDRLSLAKIEFPKATFSFLTQCYIYTRILYWRFVISYGAPNTGEK